MESFLTPKNIYVGDEAELMILLSDISIDKKLFTSENIKHKTFETDAISILKIELKEFGSRQYLAIRLKAWNTGDVAMPSLNQFGIISELPSINVQSVLTETNSSLQEKTTALLIPGTSTFIIAAAFVLVLLGVVFVATYQKFFRNKITRNKKKSLKLLQRSSTKLLKTKNFNAKSLVVSFEKYFRVCISDYFNCFDQSNVEALTFNEIENILKARNINKEIVSAMHDITCDIESVRFNNADFRRQVFFEKIKNFIQACNEEIKK